VPEAIYKELPPRLQKEVQVDRTRAPSLSANWARKNQFLNFAARKWNKNKTKEIERKDNQTTKNQHLTLHKFLQENNEINKKPFEEEIIKK
jgi:hypothetical protein